MADLLPSSPEVEPPDDEPRVLGVDSDDADEVLAALSSETARELLTATYEEPATASELADAADTSLQNAQYHLEKLRDADLIQVSGTQYSEKGREMKVYTPAGGPVVLFAGAEEESQGVERALARLLGAVAILGVASLAVQALAGAGPSGGGGPDAMTAESAGASAGLPPGLLFFLGGLLVLCVVAVGRSLRRYGAGAEG